MVSTCMPRTSAPNSREPSAYLTNACLNRFPALLDVTCESGVRRRAGEHVYAELRSPQLSSRSA